MHRGHYVSSVHVCVLSRFSRVRLCDPRDCSPTGFCVHGALQARILEWFAIPFSKGSSLPRDRTCVSCTGRQVLYPGSPKFPLLNANEGSVAGALQRTTMFHRQQRHQVGVESSYNHQWAPKPP